MSNRNDEQLARLVGNLRVINRVEERRKMPEPTPVPDDIQMLDYFASAAMQALIPLQLSQNSRFFGMSVPQTAYKLAHSMMDQREQRRKLTEGQAFNIAQQVLAEDRGNAQMGITLTPCELVRFFDIACEDMAAAKGHRS